MFKIRIVVLVERLGFLWKRLITWFVYKWLFKYRLMQNEKVLCYGLFFCLFVLKFFTKIILKITC